MTAISHKMPLSGASHTAISSGHRHKPVDGWRGVAATFVVVAHAANYRLRDVEGVTIHYLQRISEPLATTGVQIFFVISGFIITSLLIRETHQRGRISIAAFYARRLCRILPPLICYYAAVLALTSAGFIVLPTSSLISSATFTCNTGIVDCDWWVAHTWSLGVEEQFYLIFPFAFLLLSAGRRGAILVAVLLACIIGTAVQRPVFHANFTSFGCIAAGALYATSPVLRSFCQRMTHLVPWLAVVVLLMLVPLTRYAALLLPLLPLLIAYLVFAGNALRLPRIILESRVVQWLGLCSYSLYLWQQLFLADVDRYLGTPPPLVLLPIVVIASVWVVEKPFIRIGRYLSHKVERPTQTVDQPELR